MSCHQDKVFEILNHKRWGNIHKLAYNQEKK